MLVLLPARPAAVAIQRRGQLRGVDGGSEDVGAHLRELLLGPVDFLRGVHRGGIIAYSFVSRRQFMAQCSGGSTGPRGRGQRLQRLQRLPGVERECGREPVVRKRSVTDPSERTMTMKKLTPRASQTAVVLVALATLVAGCGSSSSTSSSTSTSASAATSTGRAKLAACLKQHGITLPAGGDLARAGHPVRPAPGPVTLRPVRPAAARVRLRPDVRPEGDSSAAPGATRQSSARRSRPAGRTSAPAVGAGDSTVRTSRST